MVVLFDLDDTLIDHTTAFLTGTEALYRCVGPAASLEDFSRRWSASQRRHYDRFLAGEISHDEQRRARTRDVVGSTLSDAEADDVFAVYHDAYEAAWTLFPDVLPCLERLSGYRLGVISNGQRQQQMTKLARTGVADRFDFVLISEECGYAKPHAQIFQTACDRVGVLPNRALYVGDLYELDAVGARRAGMTGVWLDRRSSHRIEHKPPVIASLTELPDLVAQLVGHRA